MALGFPIRPTRSSFGPTPVDRYPVRDPARELAADVGDLMMWQIAGLGVVAPVAWALVELAIGPTVSLIASAEAWDSAGASLPTVSRSGVGAYQVSYAATVTDKDGDSQTTNLLAATVAAQTLADIHMTCKVAANKRDIDVRCWGGGGAVELAVGDQFMLAVW